MVGIWPILSALEPLASRFFTDNSLELLRPVDCRSLDNPFSNFHEICSRVDYSSNRESDKPHLVLDDFQNGQAHGGRNEQISKHVVLVEIK